MIKKLAKWTHVRSLVFLLLACVLALFAEKIVREQKTAGVPQSTLLFALGIVCFVIGLWGTYRRRSLLAVPAPRETRAAAIPTRVAGTRKRVVVADQARVPVLAGADVLPVEAETLPAFPVVNDPPVPAHSITAHPDGLTVRNGFGHEPSADVEAPGLDAGSRARWAWLALRWFATLGSCGMAYASMQILRKDWLSPVGTYLFLGGLVLLLAAWARERIGPLVPAETLAPGSRPDAEEATDWRMPVWAEVLFVVAICALALATRLYNLDNLFWGMHGDEGEAGVDALGILAGTPASPFTTGWYAQPNVYYWSVALGLKLFGMNIFGLRISAVLYSLLAFPFFYLLLRRMFGVRAAWIGTGLFAGNLLFLHYSRVQFSNITTPVFWIIGFYFLVRGLQTRRVLFFILAAYASLFSLYFYNGARIIPFMFGALFLYMVIFQRGFLTRYFKHMLAFGAAAFIISAPFIGYYLDHSAELNSRTQEKLIFNNIPIMTSMYGAPGTITLPGGSHFLVPANVYYIWNQLTMTLSMFSYRATTSSIFGFTLEPVVSLVEGALLVLGMAMAFWRWRDTRFALLLLWFWAVTLSGGVLTIEAPYTDRLAGVFPTIPIFVALVLSKLAAEWVASWRSAPLRVLSSARVVRAGAALSITALVVLVGWVVFTNLNDYFGRYLPNHYKIEGSSSQATAQNIFVQKMGPAYKYLEIGETLSLGIDYGTTRFLKLATNTDGQDMYNLGGDTPIHDSNGKSVFYIVNNGMLANLGAVKAYYPEGKQEPYMLTPNLQSFVLYTLTKEQIAARQTCSVVYTAPGGAGAAWQAGGTTRGIGTRYRRPPAGMTYPLSARWSGGLFAGQYGTYGISIQAPDHTVLAIDGRRVLETTGGSGQINVVLARGIHSFTLDANLADAASQVSFRWQFNGAPLHEPAGPELWSGPMGGLLGEIYRMQPNAVTGGPAVKLGANGPAQSRRIESVLDWRGATSGPDAIAGEPFTARWTGKFLASTAGSYRFELFNTGDAGVWIDGQQVTTNTGMDPRGPSTTAGMVNLTPGPHDAEVRYSWQSGWSIIALYVTDPQGNRVVANGTMFQPVSGVWMPGEVSGPAPGATAAKP